MPLEEIEKKLYREEFEGPKKEKEKFEEEPEFESWHPEEPKEVKQPSPALPGKSVAPPKSRRRLILIGLFALFLILVGGGLYFWYVYFPQNRVEIVLSGPKEVKAGETATYLVRYKNNTRTILKDAELILRYPQGVVILNANGADLPFFKKSLGAVGIGSEAEEVFSLLIFGEPLTTKKIEAALVYQPANLPRSRLENKTGLEVAIAAYTLGVDLFLPNRIIAGESFTVAIQYRNNSDFTFPDAKIVIDYPDNFTYLSSDLKPSQNDNVWLLGILGAYSQGQIEIKGVVSGRERESKEFKVRIGISRRGEFLVFRESKSSIAITGLPLVLNSAVNYSTDYVAKPGEVLNFRIAYKNVGDFGLAEVALRSELTGAMFDFRSVEVEGGSFSSVSRSITWNAGSWPAFAVLEPGEEGEVSFRVRVSENYPIRSAADKNFVLRVKSTIETPTVPSYLGLALAKISVSGEIAVKVGTELRASAKGYFRDPAGYIKNFGLLPPKVGEVTNYTIHWQVVNPSNDLENVVLRTTLPAGISWTGEMVIPHGAAKPVYNERTGEIIWSIGRVPAQSGIISPAFQAYFQVAALPSLNQIGNLINIINETEFSGRDVFTGVDLAGKIAEIRSNLPDDPSVIFEQGIVRE